MSGGVEVRYQRKNGAVQRRRWDTLRAALTCASGVKGPAVAVRYSEQMGAFVVLAAFDERGLVTTSARQRNLAALAAVGLEPVAGLPANYVQEASTVGS